MEYEVMNEVAALAVLLLLAPYVLGAPIAVLWVGFAWATGWDRLLPADVRYASERKEGGA